MKNVVMLLLLVAMLLLLLLALRFIGGAEKRRGRGAWAWESPIQQAHRYNTYEIRT